MPQIRLKPPSRQEQLKLKVNPFAPVAYNKYTHQLIDYHMHNHTKRIMGAKSRIDMATPQSAVKCIKSRNRFQIPAKTELNLDTLDLETSIGSIGVTQTSKFHCCCCYCCVIVLLFCCCCCFVVVLLLLLLLLFLDFQESKDSQAISDLAHLDGLYGNPSTLKPRITKTGKQTYSRKTTTKQTTTTTPWRHTTKSECLGQKTNFPSLVTSVCATQLATNRKQRNVSSKYKHIQSKIKQKYFVKQTSGTGKPQTNVSY